MKNLTIKSLAIATVLMAGFSSCEDFLDRPTEDSYSIDGFYQTDEQCFQSVNPIYNSPWYDFQRGFVKIGDVLAGNMYYSTDDAYQSFVLKSSDDALRNASASLWSVNAYCNSVIQNIDMKAGPDVTTYAKNTVKGEAMTWKAMAYFFLVRCFGAVPIIHDNAKMISDKNYNGVYKAPEADVYTYIIKTLEKAIELLPEKNDPGRIDKYGAYGLLSKVYLTRSGLGHSDAGVRDENDLEKAAEYAGYVIEKSGRVLVPKYSDIFRLANNFNDESLIAWRWTVGAQWTSQNTLQSDLALNNFSEFADTWGTWVGISIDLEQAFGEDASSLTRNNTDARRKATMMMQGDHYEYFWQDKGGFDYDWTKAATQGVTYGSGTGSNCVKHIVGNNYDHELGSGMGMARMATALSTHILRLADVYLIYAEAVLGNNASTSDAKALAAFNAVRGRSVKNYVDKTSITFDDIFKERRLELAGEGDNWYDFVRLSYYKPDDARARLAAQERGYWNNLEAWYKGQLADKSTVTIGSWKVNASDIEFTIPFPDTDLAMNPHLSEAPVAFDFSSIGY
ncbi:MAG: RagB/SusD family nutrient uptake outer membrane protein [Bacteroidota bacterium]|nr:RagB/SusD family nutrient uptake outer membrane protein [Bacteroidota bacterium]